MLLQSKCNSYTCQNTIQPDLNAGGEKIFPNWWKTLFGEVNHLFDYQMSSVDVKQHITVL